MSDIVVGKRWVAIGAAGAVGSIHSTEHGYEVRMLRGDAPAARYPTLDIAKSAVHANLLPGSDWPEFREH